MVTISIQGFLEQPGFVCTKVYKNTNKSLRSLEPHTWWQSSLIARTRLGIIPGYSANYNWDNH